MLDLAAYRFAWVSVPFLGAAATVAAVLLYAALVRGAVALRAPFLGVCALVLAYLIGSALAAATSRPSVAADWYRLVTAPLPVAAWGILVFDLTLARVLHRHRLLVAAAAVAAAVDTAFAFATTSVVAGPRPTPAGMLYFRAGAFGWLHVAVIGACITTGSVLLLRARTAEPNQQRRRHLAAAAAAFSLWSVGIVDILLAYGIGWYPLSWLFIAPGALLALRSLLADDLLHAASLDPAAPLAIGYLGAAGVGVWAIAAVAHDGRVVAVASLALFFALRIGFALARRRAAGGSDGGDSPLDRALERWAATVQRARAENEIATATEEMLRLALGCERAAVLVPSAADYSWRVLAGEVLAEAATPDPRLIGWWLGNASPLPRDELLAQRLGDLRPLVERLYDAHGAEVLVPLASRDELVGLVAIGALPRDRALRVEELRLLARLQEHLTAALVYMSMYRETNTRVEVAKEVELAAAVQESFLPTGERHDLGRVVIAGAYTPASRCGGDFWSVSPLPGGRVLVLVGDVTGHGVGAAMITAAARGCGDVAGRLMSDQVDLEQLLDLLDAAVRRAGGDHFHMTCFATLLDPAAGTIAFANAGHVMPYLCRADASGARLDVLVARGNPLGSAQRGERRAHARPLAAGDLLVWYTDGLVEATDLDRQPYGDRRFQRAIRRIGAAPADAKAVRDELLRDAALFLDGYPPADDVTLVVARVT